MNIKINIDELIKINSSFNKVKNRDQFDNLTIRINEFKNNSILFYNLKKNEENIQRFNQIIDLTLKFSKGLVVISNQDNLEIQARENLIEIKDHMEFLDIKEKLSILFFPISKDTRFCAITGTNGKTTLVNLLHEIAIKENKNSLCIGTLGIKLNQDELFDYNLTTPDITDFYRAIYTANQKLIPNPLDFVFFEFSSHSLVQKRLGNIKIDVAGFTNLSLDHLDFHKDMESYLEAKLLIFEHLKKQNSKCFFSIGASEIFEKINFKNNKILVDSKDFNDQNFSLVFRYGHSFQNITLALKICEHMQIEVSKDTLLELRNPKGRFDLIEKQNNYFVIDYAHTPDALMNVIKLSKKMFETKKIITLFGCGGDRDRSKRSLMGKIAFEESDYAILTSDNPRFEENDQIFNDVKKFSDSIDKNLLDSKFTNIEDRKQAIEYASAKFKDSVILITGKGAENYLDIKGVKYPYSDYDVVKEIL